MELTTAFAPPDTAFLSELRDRGQTLGDMFSALPTGDATTSYWPR